MTLVDRAPLPRRRLLLLAIGTALALVVWVALVVTAVRLVGDAAGVGGWLVVVLVSAGAAAALFVGLLLGVRLVGVLRRREPVPAPPRPRGGKRAAR